MANAVVLAIIVTRFQAHRLEKTILMDRAVHGKMAWSTLEAKFGNVCVVRDFHAWTSETRTCASVDVHGTIFQDIGVSEADEILFQQGNTFDKKGVNLRTGRLFAPGYPLFSRLAWSNFDGFCLNGPDVAALSQEEMRISRSSRDPAVKIELYKLSLLIEHAQSESQKLCFN